MVPDEGGTLGWLRCSRPLCGHLAGPDVPMVAHQARCRQATLRTFPQHNVRRAGRWDVLGAFVATFWKIEARKQVFARTE